MSQLRRLPVAAIYGNPNQPRKTFDEAELEQLAASIEENGLKQPITVRADGEGRWMIVMGERRFRAHQLLGRETIEAQVSEVDDRQLAIDAIIENDQRVDVSPLEQAHAYRRAMDEHGMTVEEFAKKVGKPVWRIEERTNLLSLTEQNQQLLKSGAITSGHAWYLVQLPPRKQDLLVKAIATGQCQTTSHLKAMFETIRDSDAQNALFDMEEAPATAEEKRQARGFEEALGKLAAMLRSSIADNQVRAVAKVKPHELGRTADLLAAMQVDIRRLEAAFRVAAAGAKIAEEE